MANFISASLSTFNKDSGEGRGQVADKKYVVVVGWDVLWPLIQKIGVRPRIIV